MIEYSYIHDNVNNSILHQQIEAKEFSQTLLGVTWNSGESELLIQFDDALTTEEKQILDYLIRDNHPPRFLEENFVEKEYSQGKLSYEKWYETDNRDNTFSGLAKEINYTYQGNTLISRTEIIYRFGGIVDSSETYEYFTETAGESQKLIIKRGSA